MLIPSWQREYKRQIASLSRRVNANSQPSKEIPNQRFKLIKKGEC